MAVFGATTAGAQASRVPASQLLLDFAYACQGDRVTLGQLLAVLEDRAYGVLLLFLAFPNIIPTPIVGLSALLGMPMAWIAAQLMFGFGRPRLPGWLMRRSMPRPLVVSTVERMVPSLRRAERLLRPRLPFASAWTAERLLGGIVLVLAVVLALPIPLGNMLPALAVSLIALGLVERDGLCVGIGVLTGLASLVIVGGVVVAMAKAAVFFLRQGLA